MVTRLAVEHEAPVGLVYSASAEALERLRDEKAALETMLEATLSYAHPPAASPDFRLAIDTLYEYQAITRAWCVKLRAELALTRMRCFKQRQRCRRQRAALRARGLIEETS